jgi:hypothetical protein
MRPTVNQKRVERLEKTLARAAREQGLHQERLRRWVSFLVLCGLLERAVSEGILSAYCLKGGVALELRFAAAARPTKDMDLGLDGTRADRLEAFRQAGATPRFHESPIKLSPWQTYGCSQSRSGRAI